MNRRGFIGLFAAMIATPFAVVFSKYKMIRGRSRKFIGLPSPEFLEQYWLDGAPLGVHCKCESKVVVERGQYSDPPENHVFKAYVEYCNKHGFQTDCWMCGDGTTTEVCRRDHRTLKPKNMSRELVEFEKHLSIMGK